MEINKKVFGRKRVYTLVIQKCVHCQLPIKKHPRCKVCTILLHREAYSCNDDDCQQPHTQSKNMITCNSCLNVSKCLNEYHFYSPKK